MRVGTEGPGGPNKVNRTRRSPRATVPQASADDPRDTRETATVSGRSAVASGPRMPKGHPAAKALRRAVTAAMGHSPAHLATLAVGDDSDRHAALLRTAIRDGKYTPRSFFADVQRLPEKWDVRVGQRWRLDDSLANPREVFAHKVFCSAGMDRKHGHDHYAYIPTSVHLLEPLLQKLRALPSNTVMFDIGCGRGRSTLLPAWATGQKAIGIEFNEDHCRDARQTAAELGLKNVEIMHANAFDVDYAQGDVFHMFAPITGEALDKFLETKLRPVAREKRIYIHFLGPGTWRLDDLPWLEKENGQYFTRDESGHGWGGGIYFSNPDIADRTGHRLPIPGNPIIQTRQRSQA